MRLTCDPDKNRANIRKHGISLAETEAVFYDPFAIAVEDSDHGEERFVAIGAGNTGIVLVVSYTCRYEDEVRAISARKASRAERMQYEG